MKIAKDTNHIFSFVYIWLRIVKDVILYSFMGLNIFTFTKFYDIIFHRLAFFIDKYV